MTCKTCGGEKIVEADRAYVDCPDCHGTGEVCCIRINRGPLTRAIICKLAFKPIICQIKKSETFTEWDIITFDNGCNVITSNLLRGDTPIEHILVTAWAVLPKGA